MAFKKFKEIGEVLLEYNISYIEKDIVGETKTIIPPPKLVDDLHFNINFMDYKASESAICEMIIFPILRESWRNYTDKLMLWSHKTIKYSNDLKGIPDYIISKKSRLGKKIFEKPLIAVVEAKKDDFEGGWAQCSLEMITIQQLNNSSSIPIYGIVCNGDSWEFGVLEEKNFNQHNKPSNIFDLQELLSNLNFIIEDCIKNIEKFNI